MLTGLRDRYSWAILPGPIGPLIPDEAMVVPLSLDRGSHAIGVLVLGISPYRRMDDEYRSFLALVAAQAGIALTDTQAYQQERERAQVLADLDQMKMEFFQNVSPRTADPADPFAGAAARRPGRPGCGAPRFRGQLETALRAAERLRRIVDALLNFAQSEAGTLVANRRPIDVGRLTTETASMFRSAAERTGSALRGDRAVGAGHRQCRQQHVVDHRDEPGRQRRQVHLGRHRLHRPGTAHRNPDEVQDGERQDDDGHDGTWHVVLTVTDTGVGIPPEEQTRVFERFYRSARTPLGGAGIGLALVLDLVRSHDGQVTLTSDPNVGSTFTVTIPAAPTGLLAPHPAGDGADQPDVQQQERGHTAITAAAADEAGFVADHVDVAQRSGDRSRVMIVEDDEDLSSYLARLLTADGCEVSSFADSESALAAVREGTLPVTDLVLTDVMLPGRSGLELVAELRSIGSTARVPIIVLTAVGGADAAADGLTAGADDYITKPFSSRELLARVRAHIELHRIREDAVENAEGRARQVREALESNRTIGTAVGVVMTAYRLTAQQGFQLLVRASQDHNRKLRDIAAEVVSTGRLPFRPTDTDDLIMKITNTLDR